MTSLHKYLKYKNKYLNLKNASEGGSKHKILFISDNKKKQKIDKGYKCKQKWITYNHITNKMTSLISLKKNNEINYFITEPKNFENSREDHFDQNSKYVIWIRHCHSCANDLDVNDEDTKLEKMKKYTKFTSLENIKRKVSREPLCTHKGVIEAINMGHKLSEYITKNKILKNLLSSPIHFFSSYLPRTFETSKLILDSMMESSEIKLNINQSIKRLCYINEEVKEYDLLFSKGSQSSTSLGKSNCHASYINKRVHLNSFPSHIISNDNYTCDGLNSKDLNIPIKGKKKKRLPNDYYHFLSRYISNKNSNIKDNCLNIIVSHGGYIRMNVLQSSENHPNNTEAYLVKYDNNNKTIDILTNILGGSAEKLEKISYPSKNSFFMDCKYTFNQRYPNDKNSIEYYGCQNETDKQEKKEIKTKPKEALSFLLR